VQTVSLLRSQLQVPESESLASWLASQTDARREWILSQFQNEELQVLEYAWDFWARPKQMEPPGKWRIWLMLAGRGSGKTRAGGEWVRNLIETGRANRVALVGPTAADVRDVMVEGEALALDTPIPTPGGWVEFGDLRPGDTVFARDGQRTRVAAVSPIWVNRQCYAVVADGAEPIVADENHSWVASSRAERRKDRSIKGESVRRTSEMRDVAPRRADLLEYEIPMHQALNLQGKQLPIPPYTLGAWLGDGDTRGHGQFTCDTKDQQTIARIRQDGFSVVRHASHFQWGIHGLRVKLREAQVAGRKHIPPAYLRASATARRELLRGLMDTDGYVSVRGQCAFDNTNLELVCQVRELLLTLGYKPGAIRGKCDKRGFKMVHRVTFQIAAGQEVPFHLERKAHRCKPKQSHGRLVRAVEPVPSVPVRCIQVAHASGTFLAGRDFVVTHNSGLLAISPPWNMPNYEPSKRRLTWPNGAIATTFSSEEPERLRGPQFDACFVAGTMIRVPGGEIPIEQVVAGSLVMTRRGPRRVTLNGKRTAMLSQVSFSNGTTLIGTDHHPVWANGRWTPLLDLRKGATVHLWADAGTVVSDASTLGRVGLVYNLSVEDVPEYFAGGVCVHNCWADELAAWSRMETWDMLMFTLRLGMDPRCVITTTPKPKLAIKQLKKRWELDPTDVIITTGSTYENYVNLAHGFFKDIISRYEGTQLGRQEIYAEILEQAEGALWRREWFEETRLAELPEDVVLQRVVVSIDPAATDAEDSSETGIIVAAIGIDGRGYVLEDQSGYYTPDGWARKALNLYEKHEANLIVAERNNGGDMVANTIMMVAQQMFEWGGVRSADVPVHTVFASKGKAARGEPVSALYEQGKVSHVGLFEGLEDQLVSWEPTSGDRSPDRLDALVWALTELMVTGGYAIVAPIEVEIRPSSWQIYNN